MEKTQPVADTVVQPEPQSEPHAQPQSPNRKKVIISLPGDNFSSKFMIAWSNILISLWSSDRYEIAISTGTGPFLPFVRMQTLGLDVRRGKDQKPFNGEKYDVWITIDSDIIFTPEQVVELIESTEKHPVVSGIYRMADLQNFAAVKTWDTEYFAKNGTFEFLQQIKIDEWKREIGLNFMPVDYTGMGFFACRKEVLDKLEYPYFHSDLSEITGEGDITLRDMSSEDVSFCQNIAKAGYQIVINTDLRVGHLKPLVI